MRISDWSSDVCSSDLDVLIVLEGHAALETLAHLANVVLETAQGGELALVDDAVVAQQAHAGAALDHAVHHAAAGDLADLRHVEHLADLGMADDLLAHRSEEHTSELQSLMRISYAVFCLKKKKNITQNNKQTLQLSPNIKT